MLLQIQFLRVVFSSISTVFTDWLIDSDMKWGCVFVTFLADALAMSLLNQLIWCLRRKLKVWVSTSLPSRWAWRTLWKAWGRRTLSVSETRYSHANKSQEKWYFLGNFIVKCVKSQISCNMFKVSNSLRHATSLPNEGQNSR